MPKKDKAPKPLNDKITVFDAVKMGNLKLLSRIVEERGDDINVEDPSGYMGETPLYYAIQKKNIDIIKYLVEHGADVNKGNSYLKTSLDYVFEFIHDSSRDDLIKYLVEHHADVNKGDRGGNTILINASGMNHNLTLVRYLVEEAGADINHQNKHGVSPLISACTSFSVNQNLPIIKYLVEHGADINKPGRDNKSALTIMEERSKMSDNDIYKVIYDYLRSYPIRQRWKKALLPEIKQMKKAMDVSNVLKYAPPGQFHKLFPGGEEYHRGAERWTSSHSFGKSSMRSMELRNGSAIAFKSSKLRSVQDEIKYLNSI